MVFVCSAIPAFHAPSLSFNSGFGGPQLVRTSVTLWLLAPPAPSISPPRPLQQVTSVLSLFPGDLGCTSLQILSLAFLYPPVTSPFFLWLTGFPRWPASSPFLSYHLPSFSTSWPFTQHCLGPGTTVYLQFSETILPFPGDYHQFGVG